jgi:hypothetical protein|tara:strand:- start:119 stop:1528 length:1410 start_codon:yes stop_codon:yes gene_type:complete
MLRYNNEIIFIGSGVSSLSCAIKLAKKYKKKITILECGGNKYDEVSKSYFDGENSGDKYLNLRDIRYRGFLGSLNRWYGWCRPVHDEQIHRWGFSKKDLEAYITEACNFFSIPKFFNKKNIWDTYEVFEMKQADKNSVNKKIKEKVNQLKNIEIVFNAQAYQIEKFDEMYEISLFVKNKKIKIKTKILVIGGGCFENSRIMLYSKLHSKNSFLSNHQFIGKKFYDHPQFESGEFTAHYDKFLNLFRIEKDYKFTSYNLIHLRNIDYIKKKYSLNHHLTFTFITHPEKLKNFIRLSVCRYPKLNDKITKLINDNICLRGILLNFTPSFENVSFLELSDTLDPNKINQIKLNYYWINDEGIIKTYEMITKKFLKDLVEKDLGRGYLLDYQKAVKKDSILGSTYHPTGGTIIGKNEDDGVVDRDLEVFKNKNLFIVGSSVFPPGNAINPTLTITALSLRLADKISKILVNQK